MKSKKGFMETLVLVIAILILFIVLIFVFRSIYTSGKATSDTEACRLSALAKANLKVPVTGSTAVYLNCKTNFLTVSADRIIKDKQTLLKFDPRIEDNQIKRAIADEMYDCWYQMGAGEYDLFGTLTTPKNCLTCAYIDFDDSYKEKYPGKKIEGFRTYLSKRIPGTNMSYARYFTKDSANEKIYLTDEAFSNLDNLDTSRSYVVAFVSVKNGVFSYVKSSTEAANVFINENGHFNAVLLMTAEETGQQCEVMH